MQTKCTLCPISCGADRQKTSGACGAKDIKIAKYYLHPFEEPPISFKNGSGCIFFCGCSLRCVFCQNYDVSRGNTGKSITVEELANIYKELEDMGAENINLVNPTHYVDDIAKAFEIYRPNIPVVYNTHGYEKIETLEKASAFTDIWLPDLKFMDKKLSRRYTAREDYPDYALPAVKFMAKKQNSFREDGKMLTGCIVRHLILPLAAYDSVNIVNFLAETDKDIYFSLMSQYTPYGEIQSFKELQRKITKREYHMALSAVEAQGLQNVYLQDMNSSSDKFIPKWDF